MKRLNVILSSISLVVFQALSSAQNFLPLSGPDPIHPNCGLKGDACHYISHGCCYRLFIRLCCHFISGGGSDTNPGGFPQVHPLERTCQDCSPADDIEELGKLMLSTGSTDIEAVADRYEAKDENGKDTGVGDIAVARRDENAGQHDEVETQTWKYKWKSGTCYSDKGCCRYPVGHPRSCHHMSGGGTPFDDPPEGTCGPCGSGDNAKMAGEKLEAPAEADDADAVKTVISDKMGQGGANDLVRRKDAGTDLTGLDDLATTCKWRGESCYDDRECCKYPLDHWCCHFISGGHVAMSGATPQIPEYEGTCERCIPGEIPPPQPDPPFQIKGIEAKLADEQNAHPKHDQGASPPVSETGVLSDLAPTTFASTVITTSKTSVFPLVIKSRNEDKRCGHFGDPCRSSDDCCRTKTECWCCHDIQSRPPVGRGPQRMVGECKVCLVPQWECLVS